MGTLTDNVASPCTGVCRIGADGRCEGCNRTLDEIAAWPAMTDDQRRMLVGELALRPSSSRR